MQSLSASSSAEHKCGLSHGTAPHYENPSPKGSEQRCGAAPRWDADGSEANQAAAAEGWRLFRDRRSQSQTLRLSGLVITVRGTKHPGLFAMKWFFVVVVG